MASKDTFAISSDSLAYFAFGGAPAGAGQSLPLGTTVEKASEKSRWSQWIEGPLASWSHDPSQLEDDGLLAPSPATIRKASSVAVSLEAHGAPAPTRIVSTGDGGVAFQFERGNQFISIEVEPEGIVELLVFDNGRLTHRSAL